MKKLIPCLFALVSFASCSTAEVGSNAHASHAPVAHDSVVECGLYNGMTKESTVLATLSSGTQVQVTDTVDQYFVKARLTKDGKTLSGYMYRTCFASK
ncbi:SH3 domain-containing protein [Hymenobacter crusticola]|uniref:SH3b domain-containing protein n=1 Tax=Hymenobacter crusticola TaxID=1770526 RepID=A0A243WJ50_9BACT|nr:SH3 domain-containing protein [Hymenobacter crusticola]OUJ75934.1 hypothetical protein BXP70_01205 [Hymenobacter crusticola]